MLTPSVDILPVLASLAPAFTAPSFAHLLTLVCGGILTPGARTVTAALRVLGRTDGDFSQFHRFFNRARWCPMLCSRLLLALLIRRFLSPDEPLVIIADEHLERRKARKIVYRALFRDPIRSTKEQPQFSWGLRWLVLALLVPVPWSQRRWALPFLVWPLLAEQVCQRLGKRHRTVVEATAELIAHVRRWQPHRPMLLLGDGTYAAVPLANRCASLSAPVTLISRLRLDAVLHDFPGPRKPGQRGATPKKGDRLPALAEKLTDPGTEWRRVALRWYGAAGKQLEIATGECLWYRSGHAPTPLRWVLVRSPAADPHPIEPGACFSTDRELAPEALLSWFLGRWNIEVTFAEVRAHLGFETQRHWQRRAVERVTPSLFALFSLVVVLAQELHPEELPTEQSAWYRKEEATFGDALAAVRRHLWDRLLPPAVTTVAEYETSRSPVDVVVIPRIVWDQVHRVACYAN